jgi:hypothetical protein
VFLSVWLRTDFNQPKQTSYRALSEKKMRVSQRGSRALAEYKISVTKDRLRVPCKQFTRNKLCHFQAGERPRGVNLVELAKDQQKDVEASQEQPVGFAVGYGVDHSLSWATNLETGRRRVDRRSRRTIQSQYYNLE